jgi:choline dehydrogenase-like flavoprotein
MSGSLSAGVVDADDRVHYTDDLYVAGCATISQFRTNQPILTIVAIAHQLARHLEIRFGGRLV